MSFQTSRESKMGLLNYSVIRDMKLIHIQLNDWSVVMKNTILEDVASEPWPSHMMIINNTTGLCFSRCLGTTVHQGKFSSSEDFKAHCDSFIQRTFTCENTLCHEELSFEVPFLKIEQLSTQSVNLDPLAALPPASHCETVNQHKCD